MDFNEAIQAHSNWKMRLRKAIQVQETLDVANIARDDQQYPEAEAMLGIRTPYTEASHQVIMAIGTLKREANL